ncbi:uncharacterized protein STEHIDRAFT_44741, partial [Stereum hirsutum FP-91666 SS1]|uniref:uncharacterized protein n=1 Tax=Stereum hirsutum (strain FP-91666) TaxID=721885 RepID=UPI0004449462
LVKMVNALTSKSSIGGPMACMYLLGHPDVYRSHDISTIYWYQYVHNVNDSIVPVDRVQDYCLRPDVCDSMSLWDWWRRSTKCKSSPKMILKRRNNTVIDESGYDVPVAGEHHMDIDAVELDGRTAGSLDDEFKYSGSSRHLKRKYADTSESEPKVDLREMHQLTFLNGHTQFMTHHINLSSDEIDVVLNLSGGSLPRRDRGNTEEYCMTMLTFFKPWRTARELKKSDQSWQQAFDAHRWNDGDLRTMKNMHVKYECNDARDDYNAQLKKGQETIKKYHDSMEDRTAADLADDDSFNELMSYLTTEERIASLEEYVGTSWKEDRTKMNTISDKLQTVGWLDPTGNSDSI